MTNEELAKEIARGLVETGVEGPYSAVSCSTAGDYPSIGMSQWEGDRADTLLNAIEGGAYYTGRAYSDIEAAGELDALAALLDSPIGREAQDNQLAQDCLDMYVPALTEDTGLTNPACIIYAGIWCPTSHNVVRGFICRRLARGYDINDLEVLYNLFREQYATAAGCEAYAEGYANRADRTAEYVRNLALA